MIKELYKYLSYAGAQKTLGSVSVQLSCSSVFNDPFDMNLEEALGTGFKEFAGSLQMALFDFTVGNIEYEKLREGKFKDQIIKANKALKASPEKQAWFREQILKEPVEKMYDLEEMEKGAQEIINKVRNDFRSWGIFCSSLRKDSLLMWAHYADEHRGVVFKFVPNIEKDSTFLASKPVIYDQSRPLLYKSPVDLIRRSLLMTVEESTREFLDEVTYTKSPHWAYEEELRLAIPDYIPKETQRNLLRFHREELTAIFLGCRMQEDHKDEIIKLAKIINPKVEIHQAIMAKREYELEFKLLI